MRPSMWVWVHKIITLPRTLLLQCTYNYIIIFKTKTMAERLERSFHFSRRFVPVFASTLVVSLSFGFRAKARNAKVLLVLCIHWMFKCFNAELLIWLIICMAFEYLCIGLFAQFSSSFRYFRIFTFTSSSWSS